MRQGEERTAVVDYRGNGREVVEYQGNWRGIKSSREILEKE
jgi:hypothetical protein